MIESSDYTDSFEATEDRQALRARLTALFQRLSRSFDPGLLGTRLRRGLRRRTESLRFWTWPRELHYFAEIPAEPARLRQILQGDPLVYPFRFPLARIVAVLESGSGRDLPVRLHFRVTARSLLPAALLIRWHEAAIFERLEILANHLLFRCMAAPLVPPGWDPALLESTDFPSLDRANFRQPGAALRLRINRLLERLDAPTRYPTRHYFAHYQVQPGYPQTVELAEVLLVPLAISQANLHSLLPPPFHPGAFVEPMLLLLVGRELGLRKGTGARRQPAIRWELRAPAELITRSNRLHGWVVLEACRVPLDRFALPFDRASASLRRTPEGLRFCAGGNGGRLLYHLVYRPRRGLLEGDGLPALLAGDNLLFLQSPESLDIAAVTETPDFAVNKIQFALDETATYEHHHRLKGLPGPARHYADQWGISPGVPEEAFYLPRLSLQLRYEFEARLRDTQYRPYPARVGDPQF